MKHHTKTKGDLAVLKIQLDLYEKGYVTGAPATEHAPFDLFGWKNGKAFTIQAKYRSVNTQGTLTVNFSNSYSDSKGAHTVIVNKDLIDLYAVYCPETDKCYYFNADDYGKSVSLRIIKPKKLQYNILLAENFEHVPEI